MKKVLRYISFIYVILGVFVFIPLSLIMGWVRFVNPFERFAIVAEEISSLEFIIANIISLILAMIVVLIIDMLVKKYKKGKI